MMRARLEQLKLGRLVTVWKYVLIPAVIIFIGFNVGFLDGLVLFYDEGVHLAAINAIFHGKVLYRDVYVAFGPLLEYMPAALMRLFGPSLAMLRAYYYVGNILSALFAYFLCTRVIKNRSSLFSALAFLLIADANITSFWASRWGGIRLGFGFLVLLCLSFYLNSDRRRWLYLAGFATSVALFTSQEIGLTSLATSIIFIFALRFVRRDGAPGERDASLLQQFAFYMAGVITIAIPVVVYLISSGSLAQYLRICFVDVPFHLYEKVHHYGPFLLPPMPSGKRPSPSQYEWIAPSTVDRIVLFYVGASMFLYCLLTLVRRARRRRLQEDDLDFLNLVVFGFPMLWFGSRIMVPGSPQFFYCLPPAIIAGCYLGEKAISKLTALVKAGHGHGSFRRTVARTINLMPVILVMAIGWDVYVKGTDLSLLFWRDKPSVRRAYRASAEAAGLQRAGNILVPQVQAPALEQVIEFLKENTEPEDKVYVIPYNGLYCFLADRDSATRFPITIYAAARPEYRREVIESLARERPKYVIHDSFAWPLTFYPRVSPGEQFPAIYDYIMEHYEVAGSVGLIILMRRRPEPG